MGRQQHLDAVKNDNGSRMEVYKRMVRGWTGPEQVTVATYTMAPHLRNLMPRRRLRALSGLRAGSHLLRVETDRYLNPRPERAARTCRLCESGCVEDEHHVIFRCPHPALRQLREEVHHQLFLGNEGQEMATFLQGPANQVAACIAAVFEAGEFERRYLEQRPTLAQRRDQQWEARAQRAAEHRTRSSQRLNTSSSS